MKHKLIDSPGKYKFKVKKDEEIELMVLAVEAGEYEVVVELTGRGAKAWILGVIVGKNMDRIRLRTETIHRVANTHAETKIHGVVKNKSIAEIEGMIKIDKKADQVTDFLTERVLLLSKDAKAIAEPSLEIEADDVRASHAATVSPVDPEQVFYLNSRGLSEPQAEREIVRGFLGAVVEKISDDKIRGSA